jgi:hypothetical protein
MDRRPSAEENPAPRLASLGLEDYSVGMSTKDPKEYPREVPRSSCHKDEVFVRQDSGHAIHVEAKHALQGPSSALHFEHGKIAVFPGDPPTDSNLEVSPIYRAPGGGIAVPTGLIFVRFSAATKAAERRDEIERAGFALVKIPSYAPQAAWVRAKTGGISGSLIQISALEGLADVEEIQPQMLMQKANREGSE